MVHGLPDGAARQIIAAACDCKTTAGSGVRNTGVCGRARNSEKAREFTRILLGLFGFGMENPVGLGELCLCPSVRVASFGNTARRSCRRDCRHGVLLDFKSKEPP